MSIADELLKWKQLLDAGAITEEEYSIQKQKLLFLPIIPENSTTQQTIVTPINTLPAMPPIQSPIQQPTNITIPKIKKKLSGWKVFGAIIKGLMYCAVIFLLIILALELNIITDGVELTLPTLK